MSRRWKFFVAVAVAFCLAASPLRAQELRKLAKGLRSLGRAAFAKEAPRVPGQPDLEELAKEIDWLEHLIESNGSVVAKHPDIWGEERLTKHRHEYEREIAKRFDSASFDAGLQAAVRRSDQSMLALAFSLNAASSGGTVPTTNNAVTLLGPQGLPSIPQSPPIGLDLKQFATKELSLEPTLVSDQLSRYLNHLNQLRRINEGADTADSPGYALNLMRIPISVLPGHRTRKGYAAEVTFTLEPYLSDDLLPTTTRSLVKNDVADLWVVPLAQLFNNDPEEAKAFLEAHWRHRVTVNRWMRTLDILLGDIAVALPSAPGEPYEADLNYLRLQRSYLQFRLTQLAARVATEREYALSRDLNSLAQKLGEAPADSPITDQPWDQPLRTDCQPVPPDTPCPAWQFLLIGPQFDSAFEVDRDEASGPNVEILTAPAPESARGTPRGRVRGYLTRGEATKVASRAELEEKEAAPATGKANAARQAPSMFPLVITIWSYQIADFLDSLHRTDPPGMVRHTGRLSLYADDYLINLQLTTDFTRLQPGDIIDRHKLYAFRVSDLKIIKVGKSPRLAELGEVKKDQLAERLKPRLVELISPTSLSAQFRHQFFENLDADQLKAVISNLDQKAIAESLSKLSGDELVELGPLAHYLGFDFVIDPLTTKALLNPTKIREYLDNLNVQRLLETLRDDRVWKQITSLVQFGAGQRLERLRGAANNLTSALVDKLPPEFQHQMLEYFSIQGIIFLLNQRLAQVPYGNELSLGLDKDPQALRGPMVDLFSYGAQPFTAPTNNGPAEPALTASQFWVVYDFEDFMNLAIHAHASVRTTPANHRIVHVMDIYDYLLHEAAAAYKFLERKQNMALWSFCNHVLARAIVERDIATVLGMRRAFMDQLGGATRNTVTAALAWAIIVDAARLNDRLIEDMRSVSMAKGCLCVDGNGHQFVGPLELITPEAHEAFRQYVRCRWPVIVFSLDPMTDDQNVADVFSRRRELQLAMSVAVSKGEVSPSAALNFARELETDMETIALNRTAVAFSHSNDTFGWRFYPRVQSPDTPGNLAAFGQNLFGGPTRDQDLRDRQLEPSVRDCAAVVIMPSFVPYVTLKSRSNWFCLTNPRSKELTLHDDMRVSRTYQALAMAARQAPNTPLYRPEDIYALRDTLKQLEHRLPLQQTKVEVPFHNNLGGVELFETGINGLGPMLTGWYGAPGIDPDAITTLYLVGKRFNVHETRIIAGGRSVPFRMLSRRVLEVTIPPGAQRLDAPAYDNFIDVQAAAPYGPSRSHLLIPRVSNAVSQARFTWSTTASTIDVLYKDANNPTPQAVVATVPPEIRFFSPTPSAPISLPVTITINEARRSGELVLYKGSLNARLDIARARYVIDGDQFAALSDALKATATTRFATEKPTPNLTVRWLVRGSVTIPGGVPEPIASSMVLDVTFKLQP